MHLCSKDTVSLPSQRFQNAHHIHTFQEKHDLYLCPSGVEKNNLQVLAMKLFSSPRLDTGALKFRLCPPKGVDGSVWQPGGQSCQLIIIFSTPETEQKIHLTPIPFPAPNSFRDPKKLPHQMLSDQVNQSPAKSSCELRTRYLGATL